METNPGAVESHVQTTEKAVETKSEEANPSPDLKDPAPVPVSIPTAADTAPDPEEDDLDDLDGMRSSLQTVLTLMFF